MKKAEAKSLLGSELHALAGRSLDKFVAMIGHAEVKITIESGVISPVGAKRVPGLEAWKKTCVSWARSTTAAGALFSRLPNL